MICIQWLGSIAVHFVNCKWVQAEVEVQLGVALTSTAHIIDCAVTAFFHYKEPLIKA